MEYPEKIKCKVCGEEKTHEHFYWKKDLKLGSPNCKKCNSVIYKKKYKLKSKSHLYKVAPIKKCLWCDKTFILPSNTYRGCSDECRVNIRKMSAVDPSNRMSKIYYNTCEICNKKFISNLYNKNTCSEDCRKESVNERSRLVGLKYRLELDNNYIKQRLKCVRINGEQKYISNIEIPQELIENKRLELKLTRLLKQNDKLKKHYYETTKQ